MADNNTNPGSNKENVWWRHWFMIELYKAAGVVLGILIVATILLRIVTRHNSEMEVPDFSGLSLKEAQEMANESNLRLDVTDSVFLPRIGRGLVFRQNPHTGSMVKKNRRILLTINSVMPKQVIMPSVIGYSLRQAKAELAARQLNVGRLIYVSDMATNNVLSQMYKGSYIASGKSIESGSEIDLELGNSGGESTFIPNVIGLTFITAKDILIDNSLNIGRLTYDMSVKSYSDTISSFVVKQTPAPTNYNSFSLGARVDLFLSVDKEKIEEVKTK
ncbi:MAG: PASTA domain-containing protein [Bacteroidales bacterium]|jgi:beta-lactam-binding protein with PASTA domain